MYKTLVRLQLDKNTEWLIRMWWRDGAFNEVLPRTDNDVFIALCCKLSPKAKEKRVERPIIPRSFCERSVSVNHLQMVKTIKKSKLEQQPEFVFIWKLMD